MEDLFEIINQIQENGFHSDLSSNVESFISSLAGCGIDWNLYSESEIRSAFNYAIESSDIIPESYGHEICFMGHNPPTSEALGYIKSGTISLTTPGNGQTHSFPVYKNHGSLWVWDNIAWKKVSGSGFVEIDNMLFKKK